MFSSAGVHLPLHYDHEHRHKPLEVGRALLQHVQVRRHDCTRGVRANRQVDHRLLRSACLRLGGARFLPDEDAQAEDRARGKAFPAVSHLLLRLIRIGMVNVS